MTDKVMKKREKVVAEISVPYLLRIAHEKGYSLSSDEALAFFNSDGQAYYIWRMMMQTGEDVIKTILDSGPTRMESLLSEAPKFGPPSSAHSSLTPERRVAASHSITRRPIRPLAIPRSVRRSFSL